MSYFAKIMALVLAFSTLIGYSPSARAADVNLDKLKKELDIMTKIIKTAFGEEDYEWGRSHSSDTLAPRNIQSLYLTGQGVVLNIQLSRGGLEDFHFRFGGELPSLELPEVSYTPLAPRALSYSGSDKEFAEEDMEAMAEMQSAVENLAEEASEAIGGAAEMYLDRDSLQSGELREKMIQLREEQRDKLREIRKKSLDTRKMLREKKKLSEEERETIRKELEDYKSQLQTTTKTYMNKLHEIQKEQEANWNQKLAKFESTLFSVLCEYGGSLRSLPDDQYLSVILSNASRTAEGRVQDRVLVFRKTDLLACRDGRISMENLKAKAAPYSF